MLIQMDLIDMFIGYVDSINTLFVNVEIIKYYRHISIFSY